MCGIFGVVSHTAVDGDLFRHLGQRNTERGNLAFGGLLHGEDTLSVFRHPTPFDGSRISLNGETTALGHVRAPTGRQTQDIAEVHPFETRDLLLAHNGLLLNHAQFRQWRINDAIQVDSQVIIGGIQHYLDTGETVIGAIRRTVEVLDGQQACWVWYKPSASLYLWRVMSPIYVTDDAGRTVFSSVRDAAAQTLLEEGIIYWFDPIDLAFKPVDSFKFYNPYKVG